MDSVEQTPAGTLPLNILSFGRVLRVAGLPIGPGKILAAVAAVEAVGIERRDDFYWALFSVFVNRRDQRELFDQAFHIFWRNPHLLDRLLGIVSPTEDAPGGEPELLARRLAEALQTGTEPAAAQENVTDEQNVSLSWSPNERLREKDFEQMSSAELAEARRVLRQAQFQQRRQRTRRYRLDQRGTRFDLRASLRQSLGVRGELLPLRRKSPRHRPPALVLICDISGSMSHYSRMLLHFAHALSNDRDRVYTFVFGTRLTNISRMLRYKDVDQALEKVAQSVTDWDGGTCIGRCLHAFNRDWSRRVLGQGADVVLVSDGLDRDDPTILSAAAERLHKSSRRLIWLNPLLRFDGFEPRAQGVRALLSHVDEFRASHNIASLLDLGQALLGTDTKSHEVKSWLSKIPHS